MYWNNLYCANKQLTDTHHMQLWYTIYVPGRRFKNIHKLLNLRAPKIALLYKNCIFECMGIFCVEFQRYPLKFHTKYTTNWWKDMYFFTGEILRALRAHEYFWNVPLETAVDNDVHLSPYLCEIMNWLTTLFKLHTLRPFHTIAHWQYYLCPTCHCHVIYTRTFH